MGRNHRIGGAQMFVVPARKRQAPPREELHYLASPGCAICAGTGWKKMVRCGCVLRRISRIAISRLHQIRVRGAHHNHHCFSRDGEYCADLQIVARRALEGFELVIFSRYLIEQQPWYQFTNKPGRGQFFHAVYRTEQRFGAALLKAGVFPPHAYFSGVRPDEPEQLSNKNFWLLPAHARDSGAEDFEARLELSGEDSDPIAA